ASLGCVTRKNPGKQRQNRQRPTYPPTSSKVALGYSVAGSGRRNHAERQLPGKVPDPPGDRASRAKPSRHSEYRFAPVRRPPPNRRGRRRKQGQDAVSHGFAALASIWRPAVKLSRRVAAAQGSQDHKLVVPPGSRPCLSLRRPRYYILASRNAPARAIQRPNRMHGGGGA